jgi:hypothetical protein
VAAIVNDQVITAKDVRDRMRAILMETGEWPTEERLLQIQEQALDELIVERGGDPATAERPLDRPGETPADRAPSEND